MPERIPPDEVTRDLQTKSDKIRALAGAGYSRSEIADYLGILYQHVRNVLVASQGTPPAEPLLAKTLQESGFERVGSWRLGDDGTVGINEPLSTKPAVYAFVVNGRVMYVGKAGRSLRQRMGQYGKPGPSQSTNQRIHPLIVAELEAGNAVDVLAVDPGKCEWHSLPVDLVAGLESGLVQGFRPPWNQQGAK